ncbi:DUF742 domain-containing protein [Nonomuraea sp. MCN248]|uniref:DUF742 domain-containing protein n=1 Tax=Nonomuraea corallina TaxID=2989783 RepID=A0ABT4S470_9ACTN|nr:DUF742 domain-containing protein [Nonomuraea corallina]MDA0631820.1 DUF742 domain-containing protein [Nonomuraea corallina]
MSREHEWVDEEAGPVVRPYAVTRGRTRPAAKALSTGLDLLATVSLTGRPAPPKAELGVQHRRLLGCLVQHARPVAEVAAELDLPVAVVRVLLGDLLDYGLVAVKAPRSKAATPSESLLREVINGLRAL